MMPQSVALKKAKDSACAAPAPPAQPCALPYSIVIPVLNEAEALSQLLASLRQQCPSAEILVVDGGSADDSVRVALRGADQVLLSKPGRARQMNLGARAAKGGYLLFLHADSQLLFDETLVLKWIKQQPLWGFCRVRLSGDHLAFRVIERAMNIRSTCTQVATGDQLLAVERERFLTEGGFADLPLMEDVEFCKRWRKISIANCLPATVKTSSRRWEERGIARTVLQMWGLRLAYVCGVSPQRLWQFYYGR
ncbi:TIGR04283 family arsenosugar biosynthesis glycosyltransferase [Sediminihaliea albiluteola]|nr:TIGR04283 family arsenosugar biosynthesis glycosyltransferase [Sediminihaliea albiluteola]